MNVLTDTRIVPTRSQKFVFRFYRNLWTNNLDPDVCELPPRIGAILLILFRQDAYDGSQFRRLREMIRELTAAAEAQRVLEDSSNFYFQLAEKMSSKRDRT